MIPYASHNACLHFASKPHVTKHFAIKRDNVIERFGRWARGCSTNVWALAFRNCVDMGWYVARTHWLTTPSLRHARTFYWQFECAERNHTKTTCNSGLSLLEMFIRSHIVHPHKRVSLIHLMESCEENERPKVRSGRDCTLKRWRMASLHLVLKRR